MPETKTCPKCGTELPGNAPSGICPQCLMLAGLDSQDDSLEPAGGSAFAVTTPQPGGFVPPEPDSLAPHFPQLEILESLGHGGMGAVYKARQTKLDRFVALKIIRPESADDPAFAERFNREARTLARLNHPNIVAVHDFGEVTISDPGGEDAAPNTVFYFLMEYVDGANLRQLIQSGELRPEQALGIIPQICEALQFAHDEGIVHRDIKPENILLDQRGRVKIADFGLAKLTSRSEQDFTLTGTHQVMGTLRYMAPEQMAGSHGVDHRADIYSLGVVFYEMLTGEVPMGQFEPPSKKVGVDARLDEVVLRALAQEPERRFQQASEMKSSVEQISGQPSQLWAPVPNSLEPDRRAGFSSIAEREIQNAWRWIAGDSGETTEQRPILPALLMIVLSIAGCLMILLPWMDLEIDQDTVVRTVSVQLVNPVSRTLLGSDVWPGTASAAAFACLGLLLIAVPSKQRLTVWRVTLMTGIAAFALLHTFLFRMDFESGSYPLSIATSSYTSDSGDPSLSEIDHRIKYREGFYGSLGLSLSLLLLSAVGIRHAVGQRRESRPDSSPGTAPPLTALRFTVPAGQEIGPQVVFHFSGLGYRLADEQADVWVFHRGNKLAGLWATDIRALHTELTVRTTAGKEGELLVACVWSVHTLGAWVGRRDIKKLEAEGHELRSLLGSDDDKESGPQHVVKPVEPRQAALLALQGPAFGLVAAGAAMLFFAVVILLLWVVPYFTPFWRSFSARDSDVVPFIAINTLAVPIFGVLVILSGFCMRQARFFRLAVTASVLCLLPLNPSWLLALPLGIWSLIVLSRSEVKAAFRGPGPGLPTDNDTSLDDMESSPHSGEAHAAGGRD